MKDDFRRAKFQTLANMAELCARSGVREVIISPGSRSAPLAVSFSRHPELRCRVVMDERAAGFMALGLAQQTRRPVGLICTSGTAALNYGPAVAEAFYQQIPLLVFTADRPPEWIDQQDGQTIRQQNIYGDHCRGSFNLPVDDPHPDAQWHAERIIAEAINRATAPIPGPVHLNVPLREPLYPAPGQVIEPPANPKTIQVLPAHSTLTEAGWQNLLSVWRRAGKKLIVGGMSEAAPTGLDRFQDDPAVAIIADLTANIHQTVNCLPQWELALETKSAPTLEKLAPDLLVTFGGPVVSKSLKLFLRKYRPQAHWHIDPGGQIIDTFQSLTQVIPVPAGVFFETLAQLAVEQTGPAGANAGYVNIWQTLEKKAQARQVSFLADAPFGEFQAVSDCLRALPEPSHLQLSNSMPIRYANFIGLAGRNIKANSNRGVSGIDGCLSTAVGAAWATDRLTTLITGDLAFFYDRNGLWHRHVPANLRVIILNNHGGGIFKLINGPDNLPAAEVEDYFFTPHPLTAKNTAADFDCDYFYCKDRATLNRQLGEFLAPRPKAAILEIDTDSAVNTTVFRQFKAMLAELTV
ncbi:MAG: 2-succinyl-5-enolpyruvyl-6-hydroxy-3-cyclohexene-1-carboxylic-acid synthase [Chloroflexota bacterium]